MRCVQCNELSFRFLCTHCRRILSEFETNTRIIDGFKVYSFYKYDDIKKLIYSKHHLYGSFIFNALAKLSFGKFANSFKFGANISAVPLDDNVRSGYSHTAILAKALKNTEIKPAYMTIRAKNQIKYSGKSLEFRQKNPRDFVLLKNLNTPVILVDDIITTGTSMKEAKNLLIKNNVLPLFGLVLADAKN